MLTSSRSKSPEISIYQENVYIFYTQGSDPQMYFQRSADGGTSFLPPIEFSSNINGNVFEIKSCVDAGGNLYVIWVVESNNKNAILFSTSTDDGVSFSPPALLSTPEKNSGSPSISISNSGIVFITWQNSESSLDGEFTSSLVYTKNGGTTFSEPFNLTIINKDIYDVKDVALGSSNVGLVYMTNWDIYYVNCEISVF